MRFSTGRASEAWQKTVDQRIDKQSPLFTFPSLTPAEQTQYDQASYRQPQADDGVKLHNLPKERYLPAEVTLENQNHVPRRGIELEAD